MPCSDFALWPRGSAVHVRFNFREKNDSQMGLAESVRAAVKLVYEYGKAIVAEESLFQLRSDLVVFREFKVSIEKSVEQSTF